MATTRCRSLFALFNGGYEELRHRAHADESQMADVRYWHLADTVISIAVSIQIAERPEELVSALGHKLTFCEAGVMSPKAEIRPWIVDS